MFLPDDPTYLMADEYASFISSLVWFRMYCVGHMGRNKNDYVKGFKSLKSHYNDELYWKGLPHPWSNKQILELFEKIEVLLAKKRLTEDHISNIGSLLYEFEQKQEGHFRDTFFKDRMREGAEQFYPSELVKLVASLFESEEYEAAVFAAFKYLDNHLQKLLSVSSHEVYGEALVNLAFATNSGMLQLNTTQNEQIGIRNLFSGANAIFRNPSAHRFVVYDRETAGAIVALVGLMVRISSEIKNKLEQS
jgi:uncharacterized protein (TIGR02391 family)